MTGLAQTHASFGGKAAVFLLSTAVSVFIAEWSVRLALPAYDPAGHVVWQTHPRAGTVLGQPGTTARQVKNSGDYNVSVHFNRHGFRDRQDVSTGHDKDMYVVGDSFAFGWGVEESERFSNVLARLRNERVFNLAASLNVDGYEKLFPYAESLGAKFGRVVLSLNMIDDVQRYAVEKVETRPSPVIAPTRNGLDISLMAVKNFLLRESAFYFLMTQSLNQFQPLRRFLISVGIIKTINEISSALPDRGAISVTADRLAALDQRYDLTVLIIPSRGLWVGARRSETREVHNRVVRALQKRGVTVIDPLPELEKGDNPLQYHFRNDGHWNPRGHWLIGEVLQNALSGNK